MKPLADRITPLIQRQPVDITEPDGQEGGDVLRAKNIHGKPTEVTPELNARIDTLLGGGRPLLRPTRAFFEPRFGRKLDQVRLHTDGQAGSTALALNAGASTIGRHIAFAPGQYQPHASSGRELIAHELTHVIQQQNAGSSHRGIRRRVLAANVDCHPPAAADVSIVGANAHSSCGLALWLNGRDMPSNRAGNCPLAPL